MEPVWDGSHPPVDVVDPGRIAGNLVVVDSGIASSDRKGIGTGRELCVDGVVGVQDVFRLFVHLLAGSQDSSVARSAQAAVVAFARLIEGQELDIHQIAHFWRDVKEAERCLSIYLIEQAKVEVLERETWRVWIWQTALFDVSAKLRGRCFLVQPS